MSRTWKQSLATIPGVGLSLLPKLARPFCWPAYAGVLSSVGLGFLISARYLLPVTAVFLVIAVGVLAFRANRRHRYLPFFLGLFAALGVLIGKFSWESNLVMYVSVGILVMASVWNAWPHRAAMSDCCAEKSIN